jgi:hypothetical protein
MHKCSLFSLLDLKLEGKLQFSHHTHLLCKPCNQRVRRATKYNITHIHLNNQDVIALPEEKECLVYLNHLDPFAETNPLNKPYQALGAWFRP